MVKTSGNPEGRKPSAYHINLIKGKYKDRGITHHTKSLIYHCDICGYESAYPTEFAHHLKSHKRRFNG
jgi:hypothetical protein